MNILSLFDGMSCGQIAINRIGLTYSNYFASEIKPHAIKVTKHNYPKTIHLGDVTKIRSKDLPKIDLFIGGSPCQDFSIANAERTGLKGSKSSLFFEFVRLLKELKPKYFLLENVVPPESDKKIINKLLGVPPILINSQLVSAQLRKRLYWTNIGIQKPNLFGIENSIKPVEDKKIMLSDILTEGFTDRRKSRALLESDSRPLGSPKKMLRRYWDKGFQTLIFKDKDTYLKIKKDRDSIKKGDIRYLNQIEMERLQTVPEGYTKILDRNKAACLLGDGWTVDVISHILTPLIYSLTPKPTPPNVYK